MSTQHAVAENATQQQQQGTTRNRAADAVINCLGKKYILLCCVSGGVCLTLGILYLAIYFILKKYTTSLHYFQTMPTYVPAVMVSIYS